MKLGKLVFKESYIDEKPTENYWRGISASINGIRIFDIHYEEKKNNFDLDSHFYIRSKLLPEPIMNDKLDFIYLKGIFDKSGKRIVYYNKEEVKQAAQVAYEHILSILTV